MLLSLPPKHYSTERVSMLSTQRTIYEEFIHRYDTRNRGLDADHPIHDLVSLYIDLRKIANHPLLVRYHYSDDALHRIAEVLSPALLYETEVTPKSIEDRLKAMSDLEIHLLLQHHLDVLPSLKDSLVREHVILNRSFQPTNYSLLRKSRS